MNTKLINFARIARKYFSEDNPQPTQNGESKPLDQIIETDPNKWLLPRNIETNYFNKFLAIETDEDVMELFVRANYAANSETPKTVEKRLLKHIIPFCRYLNAVCGLRTNSKHAVCMFIIWAVAMGYILDLSAFFKSKEAQEIAGPICVKFAEVLSRDGKRQSSSDGNTDSIHDWCEDLERL